MRAPLRRWRRPPAHAWASLHYLALQTRIGSHPGLLYTSSSLPSAPGHAFRRSNPVLSRPGVWRGAGRQAGPQGRQGREAEAQAGWRAVWRQQGAQSPAVGALPPVWHPPTPPCTLPMQAVQRAVRLVEQQEARQQPRGGSGVRPVDPREAARGKVEFVKAGAGLVSRCFDALARLGGLLAAEAAPATTPPRPPPPPAALRACRSKTGAPASQQTWAACR